MPKKKGNKKNEKGFTLIELMIVVVILGILAALAIPTFRGFMNRSRESEAATNLSAIGRGARAYKYEYGRFVYTTTAGSYYRPTTTPTDWCRRYGHSKYNFNSVDWTLRPWSLLRFSPGSDHYFQYQFRPGGSGRTSYFYTYAYTDLDCDGNRQYQYLQGRTDSRSGEVRFYPVVKVNPGE